MLHSAITRRKGAIHGYGLFTNQLIRKGTLVWELDGPTFTCREIFEWPQERLTQFKHYGFQCGIDRYSLPDDISHVEKHLG